MGARTPCNTVLIGLALALTLLTTRQDTTKRSGVPLRSPAIQMQQDTVRRNEDEQDRWFAADKLKHFGMSYAITAFGYAGARTVAGHDASVAMAVSAGAAAGVLKEIYDFRHARPFSLRDLLWDAAGVATGYFVIRQTR